MDPNMMIKMLFQMHVQNTLSPQHFKHIITIKQLNSERIKMLINSEANFREFVKYIYGKFKELNLLYGSVDCDPVFWAHVCIKTICETYNSSTLATTFTIPNGCCTQDNCSINQYYDLIGSYCSQ